MPADNVGNVPLQWFLTETGLVMADRGTPGGGYEVGYDLLAEAARGINGVISELSKLGIDETAQADRGFALLDLDGEGLGVDGLARAFSGFTGRWSWGVRTLVRDGSQSAARLGLNTGLYYNTDQYLSGVAKVSVNALGGDPRRAQGRQERVFHASGIRARQSVTYQIRALTHDDY